jgi:hypothetical protein
MRNSASPLHPGQALPLRLLLPVRPGVSADHPAADANHAGTERRHSDVIRPAIGAEHRLVVAVPARHVERRHARCLGGNWIGQKKDESGKGKATDQNRPVPHIKAKESGRCRAGSEL